MAHYRPQRLPMSLKNLESLRQLCRNQAAFEQLKQFLDQREMLYQQFSAQIAQQAQKTQELEAQKRASEAASQAKSHFLAMMSHELRTPLNSILGLSTLLSQQVIGDLNDKQREYLAYIQESGEHLLALISDILDLSKVEAGQEKLRLAEVSIPALCQSCLAMVQPRALAKGLLVSYHVDTQAEICMADQRRLRQMLLNLLSNAIKFTDRGHVGLKVERQGRMLQFEVEDTGIGIPVEKREQLFQPFTQLDGDLNRRYEGTGLGLTLTQQLAQLHGGYVTVESAVNGGGSRFLLYLPIDARQPRGADCQDTPSDPAPWPASQTTGERGLAVGSSSPMPQQDIVLLDEDFNRHQALIAYVQTCGWRIYPLPGWADVHHHLQTSPPRLLMVGQAIAPAATLTEHLERLRQQPMLQNVKIVVIRDQAGEDSQALGADAWLDLPLTIPKLERILSL